MGFFTRQADTNTHTSHLYNYVSKHTYDTRLWPSTLLKPD